MNKNQKQYRIFFQINPTYTIKGVRLIFFYLFFLIFCYHKVNSQSSDIDSLLNALKTAKDDTSKVNTLSNICFFLSDTIPEKAMQYGQEGLELAESLTFSQGIAKSYNNIGTIYFYQSNYPQALEAYQKSLKIYEELGDKKGMSTCYTNIGTVHGEQENYSEALFYFHKALKIFEEKDDKLKMASCYNNIGLVYNYQNNYKNAKLFFQKALEIFKKSDEKPGMSTCYNNIGDIFFSQGDYTEALEYYESSLKINEELGNKKKSALVLSNISGLYNKTGRYGEAIDYAERSLKISKEIGVLLYENLAYKHLTTAYDSSRNVQKAFEYYKLYSSTKDSLFNIEKNKQITEMETKYQTEKKQQEIIDLKKEKEISAMRIYQSRIIIAALIGIIVLVFLLAILLIRQNRLLSFHKTMELKQKLLRTQMNPHFIFNSLIAIQSYMYKNKPEDAGRYLSGFAKLTRLILENSNYEYISLEKEIATLKYYMELQALRFENKFLYSIDIDPKINSELVAVPPMLAQPFIENAIEHGIISNSDKGAIAIKFHADNDSILFSVEDNGSGLKQEINYGRKQNIQDRPHAISITRERLLNLNRKKKQKIVFDISNVYDASGNVAGTKVSFNIPYKFVH